MSAMRWVERAWLTAGLILLIVYVGLRIDSYVQSQRAVHEVTERALRQAE